MNTPYTTPDQGQNEVGFQEASHDSSNMGLVIRDGKIVVSSREVAEKFGKLHKDILKAIKNLECSDEFGRLNFAPSSYTNSQNKLQPEVLMTRDGFTFLAMGFTGKDAAMFKESYIAAFNKMEVELKSRMASIREESPAELMARALLVADKTIQSKNERIEVLEAKVEADAPKVAYATAVSDCEGSVSVKQMATLLSQSGVEVGGGQLFQWFRNNGYLCSRGDYWNLPYRRYEKQGLFRVTTKTIVTPNGKNIEPRTTKITGKGRVYFMGLITRLFKEDPNMFKRSKPVSEDLQRTFFER